MTSWEKRILELLAERYPSAAAATGGRSLRIRPDTGFPELAGAGADATESFLDENPLAMKAAAALVTAAKLKKKGKKKSKAKA